MLIKQDVINELEALQLKLIQAMSQSDFNEEHADIKDLRTKIKGRKSLLAELEELSKITSSSVSKIPDIPSNLPKFPTLSTNSRTEDLYKFFTQLETILSIRTFPPQHWDKAFLSTTIETPEQIHSWLLENCNGLNWENIKQSVFQHFVTTDIKRIQQDKFNSIKMESNEYLPDFIDRFSSLMKSAGYAGTEPNTISAFVNSIPYELFLVLTSEIERCTNINEIFNTAKSRFSILQLRIKSPQTSLQMSTTTSSNIGKKCNFCNYKGHTETECRKKSATIVEKTEKTNVAASSNSKTFIDNSKHNLSKNQSSTSKVQSVSYLTIDDMLQHQLDKNTNSILVPCVIEDYKTFSVLDTGAECTILSKSFAQNILKYGNKLLEPAIDYRIYFRLHILF